MIAHHIAALKYNVSHTIYVVIETLEERKQWLDKLLKNFIQERNGYTNSNNGRTTGIYTRLLISGKGLID